MEMNHKRDKMPETILAESANDSLGINFVSKGAREEDSIALITNDLEHEPIKQDKKLKYLDRQLY